MPRVIHTVALAASAAVLGAGLWRDWSVTVTGQRLVVAYVAFYVLGVVLALALRLAPRPKRSGKAAAAHVPDGRRRTRDRTGTTPGA